MNLSIVAATTPDGTAYTGMFSVQFTAADIQNNAQASPASSGGFGLRVGGNGAYPNCLFFSLDGPNAMYADNNMLCAPGSASTLSSAGPFRSQIGPRITGSVTGYGLFDGSNGIFAANFSLPIST